MYIGNQVKNSFSHDWDTIHCNRWLSNRKQINLCSRWERKNNYVSSSPHKKESKEKICQIFQKSRKSCRLIISFTQNKNLTNTILNLEVTSQSWITMNWNKIPTRTSFKKIRILKAPETSLKNWMALKRDTKPSKAGEPSNL